MSSKLFRSLVPNTVRARVALVLNGTLFVLFLMFLLYDYRNDSADRLAMKQTALDEQAKLLMPGIRACRDSAALAEYLSTARSSMEDTHAYAHVLAVDADGRFTQTGLTGDEATVAAQLRRIHAAAPTVDIDGRAFMVGRFQDAAATVYVAEDLEDARRGIREDLQRHIIGVAAALLIGMAIMNATLWLAFQRPISQLTKAVAEIGTGHLGVQIERIGAAEFDILATAVNKMSQSLADLEAVRTAQMQKALTIQQSLLPADVQIPGLKTYAHYQPTETVAGDYYDCLPLADGGALLCIADVTGHGISAALVTAIAKSCVCHALEHSSVPAEILGRVNRHLNSLNLPEMFVSMFLVRIDPKSQRLSYAGAGHPPALLCDRSQACRRLESDGPVLGIGLDFEGSCGEEPFAPGDRLLLYTDGLVEAFNRDQKQFGLARLDADFTRFRSVPSEQVVPQILQELAAFSECSAYHDDVTLLLVEMTADR